MIIISEQNCIGQLWYVEDDISHAFIGFIVVEGICKWVRTVKISLNKEQRSYIELPKINYDGKDTYCFCYRKFN
jgi:hypothetical protein